MVWFSMLERAVESRRYDDKYLSRITIVYGLIVALINYIGFVLASSGGMPIADTADYNGWLRYMNEHELLIDILSVMAFVSPAFFIVMYRVTAGSKRVNRFINMPFVFSAIGCLGWVMSFVMEFGCVLGARVQYGINITEIVFASLLNILQEMICIFTLSYMLLDFLHRKIFLPRLFPEGNLNRFPIKLKPSTMFLVVVFYLSVGIFPAFFLTSSIITMSRNYNIPIKSSVFIALACILFLSLVILWMFCDYVTNPLNKLKQATRKVMAGDYDSHVDIVSNDDFGELADTFNEMTASLGEKSRRIHAIQNSIIRGMAVMVESRDNSTGGHINRTSDCVKVFMGRLTQTDNYSHLSPEFCKAVIKAAPMHDLGKIAVDDAVLRKPGKFTDEEYAIMKTHSSEGARIVASVLSQVDDEQFKQIAINVAHYHHEKWDGNGYPERISGEDIPLEARIMALADVFDALVSKRCYKESFTYDKAFQIIEESLGSHFDPELGKVFISCRSDLEELYNNY